MSPTPPDDDLEAAARLRAAFAYADLDKAQRAEALGISQRHVTRLESAKAPISHEAWQRVVQATGVPAWFGATGFAVPPQADEPELEERVEAIEHKLDAILSHLGLSDPAELLEQELADAAQTSNGRGADTARVARARSRAGR